jgi:hypothetical protein
MNNINIYVKKLVDYIETNNFNNINN